MTTPKKPAAKKPAAKKPIAKKTVSAAKPAAAKPVAKKAAPKPAARPAAKPVAKKAAPKPTAKPAAKKIVAKKPVVRKAAPKVAAKAAVVAAPVYSFEKPYKFLTGFDDSDFCGKVSAHLNAGYVLAGSATMTTVGGKVYVGQPVYKASNLAKKPATKAKKKK
ncbi:MAG: hypothetical protein RLZZ56_895 [Actinomycetota bacterium]|jgi:hypothetical protein